MGTRCDFYRMNGDQLEWICSYPFDGYPDGEPEEAGIFAAETEADYLAGIQGWLGDRSKATLPAMGWPWPWDNSGTTDFAYRFNPETNQAQISRFGSCWLSLEEWKAKSGDEWFENWLEGETAKRGKPNFPDMSGIKNVTFGARSGLLVIGF